MAKGFSEKLKTLWADDAKLLDNLLRLAALAFFLDDLIQYRAFIRDLHIFLPTPVLPFFDDLPHWSDWVFSGLHSVGLVFVIFKPRLQPALILVLAVTALRIFGDILHLQPYVMMYGFTLLTAAVPRVRDEQRLQALRLMVVGVYFWAGFHKLNTAFFYKIFPWFIHPLWSYPRDWPILNFILFYLSFTAPVFETLISIFLLFKKTRMLATLMAFAMLMVVLTCLGPLGNNYGIVVWPWNIYLFVTELGLFLAPHENGFYGLRRNALAQLSVAIFIIAPLLGIWGWWNAGPSFKLYSGNVETGAIIIDPRERKEHLPRDVLEALDFMAAQRRQARESGAIVPDQDNIFDYQAWLGASIISSYPNERVTRTGARGLCPYLEYPATAILRMKFPGEFDSLKVEQKDEPLCPAGR